MIKAVSMAVTCAMLAMTSSVAIAVPPRPALAIFDDHPEPPFVSTPECDAMARLRARQWSGTSNVWDPNYIYYYNQYYFDHCPIVG